MNRTAFTLVELSIVLVILGLLVGGVLSGQSLIRAAELRSITAEKDKHLTALNTFRDKYFALAGDMPNAFAFWGTDCGTDSVAANTGCNGNGNGIISANDTDNSTVIAEHFKVWEHLSRAGLIEGSFDGTATDSELSSSNSPASKYQSGYWALGNYPFDGVGLSGNEISQADWVILGIGIIQPPGNGGIWLQPLLSRTDAWNIDKKTDDGFAQSGSVRGSSEYINCWDSPNDPYSIATEGGTASGQCALGFIYRK